MTRKVPSSLPLEDYTEIPAGFKHCNPQYVYKSTSTCSPPYGSL